MKWEESEVKWKGDEMKWNEFKPGDGGLAEVSAKAGGGPPLHNFAQNQFSCPKLDMLIPHIIILHTLPRGDSGICPQKLHFAKSV